MSRVNPHSAEAEKSVLGSILLDDGCLKDVSRLLTGLDFFIERHREIYRGMLALQLKRSPIDMLTLTQCLRDAGKLDGVGGASYLAELFEETNMSANVAHYCQIVKEKSAARQLYALARSMADGAASGTNLTQTIADAKSGLAEIAGSMDGLHGVSAADMLTFEDRHERFTKYAQNIKKARFKTGFNLLDQEIRGVAPGEVMTIIAYSGTFKTAFLQNILLGGVERTDFYHLFFSLEMAVEQVFAREMQIQSGASGWDVERHFSGNRESELVKEGMFRSGARGLIVCDKARLTLDKIGRYIDLASQKYGKIGAVGIDYLGLIQAPGQSLFEKTAYVSIEAKNLAKEMNVPIILLCQINRAAATGGDIETHSAKGGGDIEAAADFMLGFQFEGEDKSKLTCKILKNRNGPAGIKFLVEMDRTALQFKAMTPHVEENRKQ